MGGRSLLLLLLAGALHGVAAGDELGLRQVFDAAVVADYSEGSAIEKAVQAMIDRSAARAAFERAVIRKK